MSYGTVKVYAYKELNDKGEEVEKKITLEFNPLTLIKYHGCVGRDLLADMANLANKAGNNISSETTVEEIGDDYSIFESAGASIEFLSNLFAAMICTARRGERLDFEEVIASLPMSMFYDAEFISDVISMITFGIKKK